MVPIVAGLLMGAALGGGIAALQKKDVLQGALMGGIGGALGGAFMPAAGVGGAAAESSLAGTLAGEAGSQGLGTAFNAGVANPAMIEAGTSGAYGAAMEGGALGIKQGVLTGATQPVAAGSGLFSDGIGSFLSNNNYALAGGALGGMMAPGEKPEEADQGNIQTFAFDRKLNPGFGQPGEAYFDDSYEFKGSTPAKGYQPTQFAANGGIVGLAGGGDVGYQSLRLDPYGPAAVNRYGPNVRPVTPEVEAYNQQLMQRANQQYNINPPPAPMQVPGSAGYGAYVPLPTSGLTKPADAGIGGLRFDPKTGRYSGTFEAPGSKKTDLEKMREELDALKSGQNRYNETGGGDGGNDGSDGGANGSGEGWATGGLMRAYAMGGNIGSRYPSPDDGAVMDTSNMVGAHQTVNMAPHYPMQYTGAGYASGGHLGDYSDGGRLLKGPGDGVSDDIPAQIGRRQPARLADGEFVVPARIVSELGNGSTDAGAKRLYAMMDRVQKNRKKSVGKSKVAVDSKAYKHLPA